MGPTEKKERQAQEKEGGLVVMVPRKSRFFMQVPIMITNVWAKHEIDYNVVFVFGEGSLIWPFPYWEPES